MEPLQLYKEFIDRLEQKTAEQLKAEIQCARENTQMFNDPDIIRVVRCENCKYLRACYSEDGELLYNCIKDIWSNRPPVKPDWFCGDGGRRHRMKIYISYFSQMRNFPTNLVSLSTAVFNPKWLPLGRDKQGHIWLDIPPLKPGRNCDGFCNGNCNPKHPQDCTFLKEYRKQLDKLDIHEIIDKLTQLKANIETVEGLNNVEFALLVYEVPESLCSERVVLKQWFKDNGLELREWSK